MVAKPYSGCTRIMLWECERSMSLRSLLSECGSRVALMIGPEGGFAAAEAQQAAVAGFRFAGLGDRVLRAETAAIVGVALAAYEFGALAG
jgi:16S rRNA (uracil1498-N3)-methyltransferase